MGQFELGYLFGENKEIKEVAELNFFKKDRYSFIKESIIITIKVIQNNETKEYEGYLYKDNQFKKHLKKDNIYQEIEYLKNKGFTIVKDHPQLIEQIAKYI